MTLPGSAEMIVGMRGTNGRLDQVIYLAREGTHLGRLVRDRQFLLPRSGQRVARPVGISEMCGLSGSVERAGALSLFSCVGPRNNDAAERLVHNGVAVGCKLRGDRRDAVP